MQTQSHETTDSPHVGAAPSDVGPLPLTTPESKTKIPAAADSEFQEVLEKIYAESSHAWFVDQVRYLLGFEQKKPIDVKTLRQMQIEELLSLLQKESRKRAQWRWVSVGLGVGLLTLILRGGLSWNHLVQQIHVLLVAFGLLAAGAAASRKQQLAVAAISYYDDVRAVGPLAEALEFQDKHVVPAAEQGLIRLLPRLKASDAALLNPVQRASLNRALGGGNTALILAILKAWEQVGDTNAIPEVEKLIANPKPEPRVSEAERAQIAVAAQECLPALRQSIEYRQLGSQLLRPSDNSLTPPDTLLRPAASHVSSTPPEQLLRPTDSL